MKSKDRKIKGLKESNVYVFSVLHFKKLTRHTHKQQFSMPQKDKAGIKGQENIFVCIEKKKMTTRINRLQKHFRKSRLRNQMVTNKIPRVRNTKVSIYYLHTWCFLREHTCPVVLGSLCYCNCQNQPYLPLHSRR